MRLDAGIPQERPLEIRSYCVHRLSTYMAPHCDTLNVRREVPLDIPMSTRSRSALRIPNRTRLVTASALGALALLPSGCGSDDKAAGETSIAWISKGRCNSFFDISRYGVRLASMELKERFGDSVRIEQLEPDDCSELPDTTAAGQVSEECSAAAPQMAVLQQAIDRKFQAIAISVANPSCVGPLIDKAVESGIKVMTFDSDASDSKRHSYYGMDNEAGGRLLARTLAGLMGNVGEVAIQTSMTKDANGTYQLSTSSSYVSRMKGITEELANYPGISLIATLPCQGNEVADSACSAEIERAITERPGLKGVILARGKALRELGIASAAPTFGAKIQTGELHAVAFDAPDDAIGSIKAGYSRLTLAQKQFGWGYDVVRFAHEMVTSDFQPPEFYDAGWYAVCANNVDQYAAMWAENDFRGELEKCELLTE